MAQNPNPNQNPNPRPSAKRKRNLPGTPDPEAEVVALSPATLLAAATFTCEICGKEFRRAQNLQIHRRGHNLPFSLKPSRGDSSRKRVYVCPVESCVYHVPSRALGDLTGIKKHYRRKHGEEKERRWGCDHCEKRYAVKTDWKAHVRVCGKEFECGCGTLFSRKNSYAIHKASCDATVEERYSSSANTSAATFNLGLKANTVNRELLFPSLWGHVSAAAIAAAAGGDENEQRGKVI